MKMIVTLTQENKEKLKTFVLNLLRTNKPTIKYLVKLIGIIISCMPAAILGLFFYCCLKNDKATSLRLNKGNFNVPAKISSEGKQTLEWWFENILLRIFGFLCQKKDLVNSSTYSWCWKCDCRLRIKKQLQRRRVDAKSFNISRGNKAPKTWTRSRLLRIKII